METITHYMIPEINASEKKKDIILYFETAENKRTKSAYKKLKL